MKHPFLSQSVRWIVSCWSVSLLAVFSGSLLAEEVHSERPNLVFILADDLGYGDVGFNGQEKIKTPRLDALASGGMTFAQFYAGSPVCGPSRATLLTGMHTGFTKIRGNPRWIVGGEMIDPDESDMTMGKVLKAAGYRCGYFGKWGLNERIEVGVGHPNRHGFDEFWGMNTHIEAHFHWPDFVWHNSEKVDLGGERNWLEKKVYADDLFTDKAIEFIDAESSDEPFFIFLSFTAPHAGISAPQEARTAYEGLGWETKKMGVSHYRHDSNTTVSYAAMVSHMDANIGRLYDALEKKGQLGNTLIIFTSDNGHEFDKDFFDSNGELQGKKRSLNEGGIRVPTIAYWKGQIESASTCGMPFAFWDVLPTLADLAETESPAGVNGISFKEALLGGDQASHEYLYWEFSEKQGPQQALLMEGNWKAIRGWDLKQEKLGPIRLYQLDEDVSEEKDLAEQHPDRVQQAEALFVRARVPSKEFPLVFREIPPKRTK